MSTQTTPHKSKETLTLKKMEELYTQAMVFKTDPPIYNWNIFQKIFMFFIPTRTSGTIKFKMFRGVIYVLSD